MRQRSFSSRSSTVRATSSIITADCLHVSGSIRESSAVDVEKRPISDKQEAA